MLRRGPWFKLEAFGKSTTTAADVFQASATTRRFKKELWSGDIHPGSGSIEQAVREAGSLAVSARIIGQGTSQLEISGVRLKRHRYLLPGYTVMEKIPLQPAAENAAVAPVAAPAPVEAVPAQIAEVPRLIVPPQALLD